MKTAVVSFAIYTSCNSEVVKGLYLIGEMFALVQAFFIFLEFYSKEEQSEVSAYSIGHEQYGTTERA
jgi:hypothetical protein